MKKSIAILLVAASTILSLILSTALINYGAVELGALIYLIVPVTIGAGSILVFFPVDNFLKKREHLLRLV